MLRPLGLHRCRPLHHDGPVRPEIERHRRLRVRRPPCQDQDAFGPLLYRIGDVRAVGMPDTHRVAHEVLGITVAQEFPARLRPLLLQPLVRSGPVCGSMMVALRVRQKDPAAALQETGECCQPLFVEGACHDDVEASTGQSRFQLLGVAGIYLEAEIVERSGDIARVNATDKQNRRSVVFRMAERGEQIGCDGEA